jgi:hypothetical protein
VEGIIYLTASVSNGPITNTVGSDGGYQYELMPDQDEEVDLDVLQWIKAQAKEKVSYEATRRFQETWAAKLPWAECIKGADGLYDFVHCTMCSYFEGKDKILQPKWDTLKKHGGKHKAKQAIPAKGIRKDAW